MARILIIDDEVNILLLLRKMLERDGHMVVSATNGEDGSRLYREDPFDLIITDMIMPGKSGLQTIADLMKDYPDIKIIAISGGGAIDKDRYLSLAQSLGAQRTLQKPFSYDDLKSAVNAMLE